MSDRATNFARALAGCRTPDEVDTLMEFRGWANLTPTPEERAAALDRKRALMGRAGA